MWIVASLTFASGLVVALRMTETLHESTQPVLRVAPRRNRRDAVI
jgi:hypothetical protein